MIRNKYGFTIIELVVTLAILALLIGSAAPVLQLSIKRTKEQELKRDLWQLRDAIDAYKQAATDGLIKVQPGQSGYPATLGILVTGVENIKDLKKGKIYFLRRIPRDPFANNPDISNEETWGKRSYASSFDEPREGADVYDVYSLSEDVGLDGQPYREW